MIHYQSLLKGGDNMREAMIELIALAAMLSILIAAAVNVGLK